jgi:hypothetical protein
MFFMMHRMTTPTNTPCVENKVGREREKEEEEEIDMLTYTQAL